MKNSLCLTWNILIGLFVFTSNAEAARATTLILGKSKPELKTDTLPTGEENISAPSNTTISNETISTGNGTKLTGVPQIDYIHDPNLPRELNGYNLTDYPFYNSVPEDIDFKCDGLHDGFYASVPHKCQVYHHCLFGTRYDFLCANYTAFDQKTFICHFASEVDCKNSPKYYIRNEALYKAATTTTSAPITMPVVKSRKPQSDFSGNRRKRPYRIRKPAYEFYDEEDEYEDFPERDYYYEDEPTGSRRRKRPRPYVRDSFSESEEEEEEEEERKSKPGHHSTQSKSPYDRPRTPPKLKRPNNERDRHDYNSDSRATKYKESHMEKQRQNDEDTKPNFKGNKDNRSSEYESSGEEDRNSESNRGSGRGRDGNDHGRERSRDRNRQEDGMLNDRKPFRKRTRPDTYSHPQDYEEEAEDAQDDYYDDKRRIVRPKHNGDEQVDYDDRPSRTQQKGKKEETEFNYRIRQEPAYPGKSVTSQERTRESESKKASKSKDPDFRMHHTYEKDYDHLEVRHRPGTFRTEGVKINRQREKVKDYFPSESEEKLDKYKDQHHNFESNYRSKPDPNFSEEKLRNKSHNKETETGRVNIDIDYRAANDGKHLLNRKSQSENKERNRNLSDRPVSLTRIKGKQPDPDKSYIEEDKDAKKHHPYHRTNFENPSASSSGEVFEHEEGKSDNPSRSNESKFRKEKPFISENLNSSVTNSKSSNNFSIVNSRNPGAQRVKPASFKIKDAEEYKDYDEPVPAPRPAYITDISESTSDEATKERPNQEKLNPISIKRIHSFRNKPSHNSNNDNAAKIHSSNEESYEKEEATDYYEEDQEKDGPEKETDGKNVDKGVVLQRTDSQDGKETIKASLTNYSKEEKDYQEKQTASHHLKVPFENFENTEELAPRAPKNSQTILSSRRRPFLPSRGGNPYLPRGLVPLGSRSFSKFSEKHESATEATERANPREHSKLAQRIPEKKPLEFRTKVSASIGVEQPQLTSYYYDESPFGNDHRTFVPNRQIYSVQSQQESQAINSNRQMPSDDRSSSVIDVVGGDSKNVDIPYGYDHREAENKKESVRISSAPFTTVGTENSKLSTKNVPTQDYSSKPTVEENHRKFENSGRIPPELIYSRPMIPNDSYLEETSRQHPRKQVLNGPLPLYNMPTPQEPKISVQSAPRLGPQVFYSENPKFKTTLVVPDHLVPKTASSHLKYSTNSPVRLPNYHHNGKEPDFSGFDNQSDTSSHTSYISNVPRQAAPSNLLGTYKNLSFQFPRPIEDNIENRDEYEVLSNDALHPASMLQSRHVPSRAHAQKDNIQIALFKRRHYQQAVQEHRLPSSTISNERMNKDSNKNIPHSAPTSLRQTIPWASLY